MKKQINPTIKAHLIRGVVYLLLLLAVCAIPFALAQRDTNKRSAARVCGLLVGSGMTLGYAPDGSKPTLAGNTVNYSFGNSQAAPNDFALFETHDPWGFTVLKDAITGAGHTYTEFTPAQLAGFDFSQYRVVVLNWDDTFLNDFLTDYSAAILALEAYINAGGIVWVQAAIQGNQGDNPPMPFGGQVNGADFVNSDPIVDPASPMMVGMPNPIPGNSISHVSYSGFPGAAHIVVISGNNAQPTLYDYRPCQGGTPTPTASPTCTPDCGKWEASTRGIRRTLIRSRLAVFRKRVRRVRRARSIFRWTLTITIPTRLKTRAARPNASRSIRITAV